MENELSGVARKVAEYFRRMRFHSDHHLGSGDIRLTFGQQHEVVQMIDKGAIKREKLEDVLRNFANAIPRIDNGDETEKHIQYITDAIMKLRE